LDDAQFKDDLVYACTSLGTRGAALWKEKVVERTGDAGIARLKKFLKDWEIQKTANPKSSKAMTVARICGTVVHLMLQVSASLHNNMKLRVIAEPTLGLVPMLCQPIMASIIPQAKVMLYAQFKKWQSSFGETIQRGDSALGRGKSNTDYTLVAHKSSYYSKAEREKWTRYAFLNTPVEWYKEKGLYVTAWCAVCAADTQVTGFLAKIHAVVGVEGETADKVYNAFIKIKKESPDLEQKTEDFDYSS